jgi:hypothetical protein
MGGQLDATRVDAVMTHTAHDKRLALPCRPPPLFQVGQGSHVMHGRISLCTTQLTGLRQQSDEQFVAAVPDGVWVIVKGRTGAPLQRNTTPLCDQWPSTFPGNDHLQDLPWPVWRLNRVPVAIVDFAAAGLQLVGQRQRQQLLHHPMQLVQGDEVVGHPENGADHTSLWRTTEGGMIDPMLQIACSQELLDDPHKPMVLDLFPENQEQDPVVETVEALREISPSMNQTMPFHVRRISVRAVWHPRPGRNPWQWSLNCGS